MAPILLDTSADFSPTVTTPSTTTPNQRTLLLAPPSLSSDTARIAHLFTLFPRATTDLHMLDRLAGGLVALPPSTYDLVLVLTDDAAPSSPYLADRSLWTRLVAAVKPGGKVSAEDGRLSKSGLGLPEAREAVLAGLVAADDGFVREEEEEVVVPLRFGKKKAVASSGVPEKENVPAAAAVVKATPAGVGFVDLDDNLDLDVEVDGEDGLVDEETLLTEEDLRREIYVPPECAPQVGKKKRACKDCTCGLAERIQKEDEQRRAKADKNLGALKLAATDLNELDFTVQGKTGSCNSCYLGDAFRCADCPYTGLPAFKPGEEVKILDNVAQF